MGEKSYDLVLPYRMHTDDELRQVHAFIHQGGLHEHANERVWMSTLIGAQEAAHAIGEAGYVISPPELYQFGECAPYELLSCSTLSSERGVIGYFKWWCNQGFYNRGPIILTRNLHDLDQTFDTCTLGCVLDRFYPGQPICSAQPIRAKA